MPYMHVFCHRGLQGEACLGQPTRVLSQTLVPAQAEEVPLRQNFSLHECIQGIE